MAMVIRALVRGYHVLNDEYSDPRTKDFFLVGTPWGVLGVLIFYHYFVHKLGPAFMENRKAFNVDRIIQIYNAVQVLICSWLVYEATVRLYGPSGSYKYACQPIDYSSSGEAFIVAEFVWVYFMLKVLDLLDTVFFVLRKKNSQVTFLHVYHHTGMVLVGWGGTKYIPGGHGVFVGYINCFVHVVMYSYYFLTNYNTEYKKNVWWKKHITQLQMFQFMCIIFHFGRILFNHECVYPRWAVFIFLPQNFFMLILFWDFYKKAYLKPAQDKTAPPTLSTEAASSSSSSSASTSPPTTSSHLKAS